ncbi:MAG: prolyl oligopeptidase family serine peptidase [Cyclobacteriaceae bacterium]|nr:prolyl oligopeptidase family serine peptidase [Cyclobacteriaceae bacterium]
MKRITLFIALIITLSTSFAQVSIDNLLNVPFPTNLTVSTDGKRIAWVFNDQGARNIYVADAPDFVPRKVTNYNLDDGQEIASVQFTSDNTRILFIRGGAPNSANEIPNPIALQPSVDRAIWVINVDGSNLKKLATGFYPKLSPDGKSLAYLSSGQVWLVKLDSAGKGKKLFHSRGSQSNMRWSPDGSKLAFVSSRTDHSFIGVYDFSTNTIQFLDPSVDRDGNPVWSPDGKQIAFIRTPNVRNRLPFVPAREGHPWSIRSADVGTGKAKEVWAAKPGKGSVLHTGIPVVDNMLWWMGDRLVFPWERDGWQHLYSVSINGGEAVLLTPGEGEVESVDVARDGRSLIYVTNIGDIDRRHIYKVAVAGGKPQPLSTGDGIEYSPVETTAGIACLRTDATTAAWPHVIGTNGQLKMIAADLFPKTFPKKELVTPQAVMITATDGMKIPSQLFLPKDVKVGDKRPAVIFFHGGSRRQMVLGFHYSQYYHNAYALNQYFASQGYVVLSVNYRSGIGYGLEFREAIDYGAAGASEYRDVEGAGLYLAQRPDVDPKKIGLWGGSYGGYLTAMGLAKASDLFSCGVDIHGVHDWNVVIRNFVPAYQAEKQQAFSRKAFESSPMNFIKDWRSPVLLIHGDDDRNVPFSETVSLAENLREQGVYFEQLVFPDEVHGFLLHKNWLSAYKASADFFKRMFDKK